MQLPILAFCDGWLRLYHSIDEAAVDMEPIDVENGEWEAFDASGHLLQLSVRKHRPTGPKGILGTEEIVEISRMVPAHIDESRFRELLKTYVEKVSQVGKSPRGLSREAVSRLPFEELLAQVACWPPSH